MATTEPLEIIEPTASAVKAAQRSRDSIAEAAERAGMRRSGTVRLEELELPVSVVRALSRMVDELSEGHRIAVHAIPDDSTELTTSQAARLLGMSRPTLINLLNQGSIPYRFVGTHRRLLVVDVLAFRERAERPAPEPSREEMLRAMEEMAEYTHGLGLGY
ncbi:MAG TPA: helix-turn-helix domain-containing protein [Longimicrobium sp.]